MQELALRSFGKTTAEYWKTRLNTVATMIDVIVNTPGSTGNVELGYLPYIPSFGFTIVDPDEPHGVCFVELYHHKSAEPNPSFEIKSSDDMYWYKFFRQQFEILWESCRIETLPKSTN